MRGPHALEGSQAAVRGHRGGDGLPAGGIARQRERSGPDFLYSSYRGASSRNVRALMMKSCGLACLGHRGSTEGHKDMEVNANQREEGSGLRI